MSGRYNSEFLKVLNILKNNPDSRPLICEKKADLKVLKDKFELKADQMLNWLWGCVETEF